MNPRHAADRLLEYRYTLEQLQAHLAGEVKTHAPGMPYKDSALRIICNDGASLSVQASEYTYCSPRSNYGPYSKVEVGHPEGTKFGPEWDDYADGDDSGIWAYVPIELVAKFIWQHGGMKK